MVFILDSLLALHLDPLPQCDRLDEDQAVPQAKGQQTLHWIVLLDHPTRAVPERQQLSILQQYQSPVHQSATI